MQRPSPTLLRRGAWLFAGVALLTVAIVVLVPLTLPSTSSSYTEVSRRLASGQVAAMTVDGERIVTTLHSGERVAAVVGAETMRVALVQQAAEAGIEVSFEASSLSPLARQIGLGVALPVLLLGVWVGRRQLGRRRQSFFDSYEPSGDSQGFAAVAGLEEPKRALSETVAFLSDPARFAHLGARHPRGILLSGEPGTGKTMLARAVAQEAGVAFLSCSGSSFQEMFVGVGASRIRMLFKEAKRLAPCIVFIDEIDAVGRARGASADPSSGEHDRTLNQLLVQMDGFDERAAVIVMATTNRADILDKALVRPGRFDRCVHVPLPCLTERQAILGVHARRFALADDVDLGRLARTMVGASGADLANVLNEAALIAARTADSAVRAHHVEAAREVILLGDERPGMRMTDVERHATAVHEAGHALVAMSAPECDDVHKVSILPRGKALGVTQALPREERVMFRKAYLEDQICMLLGGRAAELEVLHTATAGAADDLRRASDLARTMVGELGMGELGCLHVSTRPGECSSSQLERVDADARRLLDEQLARARAIVRQRADALEALVGALMDRDVVEAEELARLVPRSAGEGPPSSSGGLRRVVSCPSAA